MRSETAYITILVNACRVTSYPCTQFILYKFMHVVVASSCPIYNESIGGTPDPSMTNPHSRDTLLATPLTMTRFCQGLSIMTSIPWLAISRSQSGPSSQVVTLTCPPVHAQSNVGSAFATGGKALRMTLLNRCAHWQCLDEGCNPTESR